MAEEVKKPRTRKPRTPKTEVVATPDPVITEEAKPVEEVPEVKVSEPVPENVEEPVVETQTNPVVEETPEEEEQSQEETLQEEEQHQEEAPQEEEPQEKVPEEEPKSEWIEDVNIRIQASQMFKESTELPAEAPKFEEKVPNSPVQLQKLNPNLPDGKSKWIAFIPTKTGRHILFKGAYAKAARAAKNYNEAKGFAKPTKKIRSN